MTALRVLSAAALVVVLTGCDSRPSAAPAPAASPAPATASASSGSSTGESAADLDNRQSVCLSVSTAIANFGADTADGYASAAALAAGKHDVAGANALAVATARRQYTTLSKALRTGADRTRTTSPRGAGAKAAFTAMADAIDRGLATAGDDRQKITSIDQDPAYRAAYQQYRDNCPG
jgi:hypothetical protein